VCVYASSPPPLPLPPLCFSLGRCSCATIPGAVLPSARPFHVALYLDEARTVPVVSPRAMKTPPRYPRGQRRRRRRRSRRRDPSARVSLPRNLPPPRSPLRSTRGARFTSVRSHTHSHAHTLFLYIFLFSSLPRDHDGSVNPPAALPLPTVGARARHHYLRQIICDRGRPVGNLSRLSRIPSTTSTPKSRATTEFGREARAQDLERRPPL